MSKYTQLFEKILNFGNDVKTSIFDDISDQESKVTDNKDLYDVFMKLVRLLDSPAEFEEIQSVAPTINVNTNTIVIDGTTRHSVDADRQAHSVAGTSVSIDAIIDAYFAKIKSILPKSYKATLAVAEDALLGMDKKTFTITIEGGK